MVDNKTGILERDSFYIFLMTLIIIGFFGRILFTTRSSGLPMSPPSFSGCEGGQGTVTATVHSGYPAIFQAGWSPLSDGGRTLEGAERQSVSCSTATSSSISSPFPPALLAVVLAMCWSSIGTFLYCSRSVSAVWAPSCGFSM